jgi:hypothetical protein
MELIIEYTEADGINALKGKFSAKMPDAPMCGNSVEGCKDSSSQLWLCLGRK